MWWFVSLIYAEFLWHDEHAWKTLELHYAKLLSRSTSLNIGLGLFLFTSDHFILFFTKSHVRRLIFLVQIFYIKYVINVNMLCTTFNAEPNKYIDLKKMMYRQEQSISLTSFLSWFKLDRKCIYICNLAAGFCAVHNNPSVAETWTLSRLGKSIWSYYWHFLSNLNNTRKPLVCADMTILYTVSDGKQ